jgi:enoyl-[acyl-carrier protein] reductase I
MGILSGKRGLVVGVSNKWSIGNHIAKTCLNEGADVIVTWHSDRNKDYVSKTFDKCFNLDLTSKESLIKITENLCYNKLDFIVHSVAKAPRECFEQPFYDITIEQWNSTMLSSVWSFVALVKEVLPLLNDNASIVTMSYLGGRRIRPGYNVMGVAKAALDASVRELAYELGGIKKIRVNGVAAGPIKTVSSAKIKVNKSINDVINASPLKRPTTYDDISNATVFLLSDLSSGITGSILDVDSGYNIMQSTIIKE